jgi:hypothetical protein
MVRNAENALRAAGYTLVLNKAINPQERFLTVQKGQQWLAMTTSQANEYPMYQFTSLLVKEMEQEMQANADAWIDRSTRAPEWPVYGINFHTGKSIIRRDSDLY